MKNVLSDYSRLNDADFAKLAGTIVLNMTGNVTFDTLKNEVDAVALIVEDYTTLLKQSNSGSRDVIAKRIEVRATLTTMLQNLGANVNAIAKGNVAKLATSGFMLSKTRGASAPLVQPAAPVVATGINKGEIRCTGKRQKGMISFSFLISIEGSNKWQAFTSSRRKFVFSGLAGGGRYLIKYAILGVRNQVVESDAVTYIAQ